MFMNVTCVLELILASVNAFTCQLSTTKHVWLKEHNICVGVQYKTLVQTRTSTIKTCIYITVTGSPKCDTSINNIRRYPNVAQGNHDNNKCNSCVWKPWRAVLTCDLWLATYDLWLATCDLWLVTCDL